MLEYADKECLRSSHVYKEFVSVQCNRLWCILMLDVQLYNHAGLRLTQSEVVSRRPRRSQGKCSSRDLHSTCRTRTAAGLSGFRQSAVNVPLIGQVVEDTVIRKRFQLWVDNTVFVPPVAPLAILLWLLLLFLPFFFTLLIASLITLHLKVVGGAVFDEVKVQSVVTKTMLLLILSIRSLLTLPMNTNL